MEIIFGLFNTFFFAPIVNLLVAIYQGLQFLHIPGALGFAIIILTIVTRMAIWPLFNSQIKSSKKMSDLKPHLDELKQKHKDDKKAFAEAQMALFKEHGVNPAAGCLPTLLQFPILIALYQAIMNLFPNVAGFGGSLNNINAVLWHPSLYLSDAPDKNFLGLNLATRPSEFMTAGWLLLLVPLVTAGLTFWQSKMMLPKVVKKYPSDSLKEKKEKENTEDAMASMQKQMTYLMPIMIGWFAFQFPVALPIYWNTLTIISIIQQKKIYGK